MIPRDETVHASPDPILGEVMVGQVTSVSCAAASRSLAWASCRPGVSGARVFSHCRVKAWRTTVSVSSSACSTTCTVSFMLPSSRSRRGQSRCVDFPAVEALQITQRANKGDRCRSGFSHGPILTVAPAGHGTQTERPT